METLTLIEIIAGTVATLLTGGGLTTVGVHLKQWKRGFTKKKLAEKLNKMEEEQKEMQNKFKSFEQKLDLVIELLSLSKNRKKKHDKNDNENGNTI